MSKIFVHYFDLIQLKEAIETEIEETAHAIASNMLKHDVIKQELLLQDKKRVVVSIKESLELSDKDKRLLKELKNKLRNRQRFLKVVQAHELADLQKQLAELKHKINTMLEDDETRQIKLQIARITQQTKKQRKIRLRVTSHETEQRSRL